MDSLKKAFSRQNIEKKMTKIGTKIVSQEQREKIKKKTSTLKVSPLGFNIRKVVLMCFLLFSVNRNIIKPFSWFQ